MSAHGNDEHLDSPAWICGLCSDRLWSCGHARTLPALKLSSGDLFAFGVSITSVALCFGLSATFHTLRSHSYNVHHFWGWMDIFGVCLLALGGGASATYYVFYCNPEMQRIYWAINALSALAVAITLFDTGSGGSKMRTLRGGVFPLFAGRPDASATA